MLAYSAPLGETNSSLIGDAWETLPVKQVQCWSQPDFGLPLQSQRRTLPPIVTPRKREKTRKNLGLLKPVPPQFQHPTVRRYPLPFSGGVSCHIRPHRTNPVERPQWSRPIAILTVEANFSVIPHRFAQRSRRDRRQ